MKITAKFEMIINQIGLFDWNQNLLAVVQLKFHLLWHYSRLYDAIIVQEFSRVRGNELHNLHDFAASK